MSKMFKKISILVSILALFVLASCAQKAQVKPEGENAKGPSVMEQVKAAGFDIVDYDYVKAKVGDGLRKFNQVAIIDARPERKFDSGHIPSAINIPDTKFDKFYPQLEELKVTKDTELIVYCGGFNCIKSYNDAKYLRDKGYKNIKVYLAGDPDWSKKNYFEIGFNYAKSLLNKGVLFVDARPERVYKKGTIPGSINIPDTKFLKDPTPFMDMLPTDKNSTIVVFCGGYVCVKSHKVAEKLYEMGYKKVLAYAGGVPEWKEKGEQLLKPGEKVDTIGTKAAAATDSAIKAGSDEGTVDKEFFKTLIDSRPDNIVIVDVRTPSEFQNGHVEGAINIPVDDMYKDCGLVTSKLPKDKYVIFMCATGGRAGEMYFGLKDDCKYPNMDKLFFLDAHIDYSSGKCVVK